MLRHLLHSRSTYPRPAAGGLGLLQSGQGGELPLLRAPGESRDTVRFPIDGNYIICGIIPSSDIAGLRHR